MAINATAIWRVRPSGSNTNGGGFDAAISGAGTDYSQQNAAQASGTHGTAAGTATFTDATANLFTSAMVGNALYLTGTGLTTGWYFVTAYTSSSIVTLDRSPGTGTVGTWNLGGGWAEPFTNIASGPLVSGNQALVLGSGIPNPSAYVYDYVASAITLPTGSSTVGNIVIAADPATPGYKAPPNTTGGMPTININSAIIAYSGGQYTSISGLWFVTNAAGRALDSNLNFQVLGCVFDQNGHDQWCIRNPATGIIAGCEFFSSSGGTGGTGQAIAGPTNTAIIGCNIHDTVGPGIQISTACEVISSIIAKTQGDGINVIDLAGMILNCTIDGNVGNGITVNSVAVLQALMVMNNIISNQTGGGSFGLSVAAGSTASNDRIKYLIDYNTFFNNTGNYNAISAGPHDTTLSVSPYVNSSSENYTLA